MIKWLDMPTDCIGTPRQSVGGVHIAFTYPEDFAETDVDLDGMIRGNVFKPLGWKENYHIKASGVASSNDGQNLLPKTAVIPPADGQWYIAGGVRATAAYLFWCDSPGYMLLITGKEPYMSAYVIAAYCDRVKCATAYVHIQWGYDYSSKPTRIVYSPTSNSRPGGQVPIPKLGSKFRSISEAISGVLGVLLSYVTSQPFVGPKYGYCGSFNWTYTIYGTPGTTVSDLKAAVYHYRSLLMQNANKELYSEIPALQATAFDQVNKFDGNMLSFVSELDSFGQVTFQSLADLWKSGLSTKQAASFWLSSRYGDRLSFKDARDLFRAVDESLFTIRPKADRYIKGQTRKAVSFSFGDDAGDSIATGYVSCLLAVTPKDWNALMRSIRRAYEWDYMPTLSNVWDMIPMSFVVDWFVNVSDIFESVDRMVQSRYYDVAAILHVVKATGRCPGYPGVELSYFDRTISNHLSLGVSSVELGLPSAINIVDGISLLMS